MTGSQSSQPDVDTGRLTGVVPHRLAAPAEPSDVTAVRAVAWRIAAEPVATDWRGQVYADSPSSLPRTFVRGW